MSNKKTSPITIPEQPTSPDTSSNEFDVPRSTRSLKELEKGRKNVQQEVGDREKIASIFREIAALANPKQAEIMNLLGRSVELVIEIGQMLNAGIEKAKAMQRKFQYHEVFQLAGFNFSYSTSLHYRNVAAFKDAVLKDKEFHEKEALESNVSAPYSLLMAYETANKAKQIAKIKAGKPLRKASRRKEPREEYAGEGRGLNRRFALIACFDTAEELELAESEIQGIGSSCPLYPDRTVDFAKFNPLFDAILTYRNNPSPILDAPVNMSQPKMQAKEEGVSPV